MGICNLPILAAMDLQSLKSARANFSILPISASTLVATG